MKSFLAILTVVLSGCGTYVENRIACTVDGQEAHFLSKWWKFSIGSGIAVTDATVICKKVV